MPGVRGQQLRDDPGGGPDPDMWTDLMSANAPALTQVIRRLEENLHAYRIALDNRDRERLHAKLTYSPTGSAGSTSPAGPDPSGHHRPWETGPERLSERVRSGKRTEPALFPGASTQSTRAFYWVVGSQHRMGLVLGHQNLVADLGP